MINFLSWVYLLSVYPLHIMCFHALFHLLILFFDFFYSWVLGVLKYLGYYSFVRLWLANIFLKSVACLFIHLTGTFTVLKSVILKKSALSILSKDVFGIKSKNSLSRSYLKDFSLFFATSFIILHLMWSLWFILSYFVENMRFIWGSFFFSEDVLALFFENSLFSVKFILCFGKSL